MKATLFRSIILVGGAVHALAAEAPKEDAACVHKLMTSLTNADYAAFVADGEAAFKAMKQEQFEAFATKISPVLKTGYEVTYLGSLNQKGYRVTLWKVSLKAGGDDLLAMLSLRDGKVGGFVIR
jgi:ABC-type transporter MlaC component